MAITPDGKTLLAWEANAKKAPPSRRLIRIDPATGAIQRGESYAESEMYTSAMSRNGRFVVTGEKRGEGTASVLVFDAFTGRLLHSFKGHQGWAGCASITADGSRVLSGSSTSDGETVLWETATGRELRRLEGYPWAESVGLSPDGKQAVIGSSSGAVVWNLDTGAQGPPLDGHTQEVDTIVFSRDGSRVATVGDYREPNILLWDTASWRRVGVCEAVGRTPFASFSERDLVLATATGGAVRLWDLRSGGELANLLVWNSGDDWLVATPDGRFDCSPGARDKFLFRVGDGLEVRSAEEYESTLHQPLLLTRLLEEHAALAEAVEFPAELPNVFPVSAGGARPFTSDELRFVRAACGRAMRAAPGIWRRATAYRSVRFYRAPSDASSDLTARSLAAANGIYLGDKFFDGNDAAGLDDKARTLLRGLVELIDGDLRLAGSKEWSELIGPRIAEVRRDVANAGGQGFTRWLGKSEAAADEKRFHSLAVARELPNLSACIDLERALTECASERGSDYRPPPDIAAFLDEHLFRLPYAPEPRLKKFHEALELYAADDSRGPAAWDELVDDPTHGTRMRLWRGYWFQFKSKFAEAAKDYAAAAASFPADCDRGATTYALLGEVLAKLDRKQEALAAFDKAVISSVGARVPALVRRGFAYESWGEVPKAVDDYSTVIEAAPELTIAYEYRAAALTKLYRYDAAAADYSSLLQLRPGHEPYLIGRIVSYEAAGKYAEALQDYDALLTAAPNRPDLLLARGNCRLNARDFDGAADDAAAIRRIFPMPVPEAVRLRALALIRSGRPRLAVAELDDLVARLKQASLWRRLRAELLVEAGELARAIAEFDALVEAEPKSVDLLLLRGAARQKAGDYRRALDDYEAGLRIDDRRADGYLARGWLSATSPDAAVRNGRRAADDALKARSLLPAGDWKIWATEAAASAELGDFAAAVAAQKSALAAGPPPHEAAALNDRLALYLAQKPYRETPAIPVSDEPAEPPPAADAFELRLDFPEGAKVQIDGTDYGDRKTFPWKNLGPTDKYVARVKVVFADGGTARRVFRIEGGRRVRLAVRAPERIVYSVVDLGEEPSELYRVDPFTFETKRLAGDVAFDEDPQLAPDGATIAYLRRETDGRSIYLIAADGTGDRRLLASPPAPIQGDLAWSPDSTNLVLGAWQGGGSAELYVADVRTNLIRHLDRGYEPAWSPDGKQILYNKLPATQTEPSVYAVAASGGEPRTLASGYDPDWSPDGTRIAVLQRRETADRTTSTPVRKFYLCLLRPDGSDLRTLTQADEYAWSPDAELLAFTNDDGLHVIRPDGTGRRTLVRTDSSARNPEILGSLCWSPDGLQVAYVRGFETAPGSTITSVWMREFDATQLEIVGLDATAPVVVAPRRIGFYSTPDWR